MAPRVSVVMSVYNGEKYLRTAVDSILNQTFTDFEFIIVDDASTDATPRILDSYDNPRLVRVRLIHNQGLAAALNEGLYRARGEYIARQDADDVSLPERLACQVAYLDQHPEVGLLGCNTIIIDEEGNPIHISRRPLTNEEIKGRLHRSTGLWHGSVMFRRTCLEQAGYYRPFFRRAQDRDLYLRMARHCEINNLRQPLYQWRFIASEKTVRKLVMQSRYSLLAVEANQQPESLGNEEALQVWGETRLQPHLFSAQWWHGRRYTARICRYWAGFMFAQRKYGQALRLHAASLFFDPVDPSTWKSLIRSLLGEKMIRVVKQVRWQLSRH